VGIQGKIYNTSRNERDEQFLRILQGGISDKNRDKIIHITNNDNNGDYGTNNILTISLVTDFTLHICPTLFRDW
jgi:hypothetical protein